MTARRVAWTAIAGVAVLLPAVWAYLRSPVPEIDPPTADQLAAAADRWFNDFSDDPIPPEAWPPAVVGLRPQRVWVSPVGLYIERGSSWVESWGVFVLRTESGFRPSAGTDPSYRALRGRVYWYEFKG